VRSVEAIEGRAGPPAAATLLDPSTGALTRLITKQD
jgi:hypothetical protein